MEVAWPLGARMTSSVSGIFSLRVNRKPHRSNRISQRCYRDQIQPGWSLASSRFPGWECPIYGIWTHPSHLTHSIPLIGHAKQVNALAFSPDSRWLATGGGGGSVHLYDLTQSDPTSDYGQLLDVENTNQNALSLDFSPDSRWLAAGVNLGNDEKPVYTVQLFDLQSARSSQRPDQPSGSFTPYPVS